jgi:multiple sugar transport system substrate-binding protein
MGKDHSTNQGPLSRRTFLGLGAGAAASMLLAACGGGSNTPPGAGGGGGSGGQFGEGKDYTGPNVSLAFWNGFTGGDGPFMRKLVDQFNSEHQNIKVSMNTLQWGDFYPKVPTAVQSGNGPDIAIMHIDQLATNAARRVIIPVDEVATVLEYEGPTSPRPSGRPASTRSSATASRWTSTRCSSTTTRRTSSRRPRTGPASRLL